MRGKYVVTEEAVRKNMPIVWERISRYLRLGISWNELGKELRRKAKREGRTFIGFGTAIDFEKGKWRAGLRYNRSRKKPKILYPYLYFQPFVKDKKDMIHLIGHELMHIYQGTYLSVYDDEHFFWVFREACAEVVSARIAAGSRSKEKPFYNEYLIQALIEKVRKLDRDELIEFVTFPKREKDSIVLFNRIVDMLDAKAYITWLKKINKMREKRNKN